MTQPPHAGALAPLLLVATLISPAADAQDTPPRSDRHYIGLLATAINHRTIGPYSERAWGNASTLVIGGHLTDLFHAEIRLGAGIQDAEVPDSDLSLSVDYYGSWYLGLHYPVTDYANIYGQFGFSYVRGSAHLGHPEDSRNSPYRALDDVPESAFSTGWLAGLDFQVMINTYLVVEGGKLFKDTRSNIDSFQFSGGLRYEF